MEATQPTQPSAAPSEEASASSSTPISLLVVHNVAKKKNFGELIRTAAAMGVEEIVVVGAAKLATHGCHGTAAHIKFSHFGNFKDACESARCVCY